MVNINSHTAANLLNNTFLPPNLFTSFVENAVKHSININQQAAYVNVNLDIESNYTHFSYVNSIDPDYIPYTADKSSELGLVNIQRRLQLLYGDVYTLDIKAEKKEYKINLTIPI